MGCNCKGKRSQVQTTINSTSPSGYQVYRNDVYTGRQFSSLISAQTYASKIGGEVRSV